MDALDVVNGAAIAVGHLASGATFLSEPMAFPGPAIRVSFEIRASRVGGTPTLTVKIRQGNSKAHAELIDRAITSPTALVAFTGEAKALAADDVVANFVQLEIVCTDGSADVTVVAAAR